MADLANDQDSRIPAYQPLVLALLAIVVGILLDWRLDAGLWIYIPIGATVILIAMFTRSSRRPALRSATATQFFNTGWSGSVLLLIALAMTSASWHSIRWNWHSEFEIGLYASQSPQPICIEGVITSEPRMVAPTPSNALNPIPGRDRVRSTIRVLQIRDGENWKRALGKADLVIHGSAVKIRAGDTVRVYGRLVPINGSSNPGQFDFQNFYRAKDRFAVVHAYHPHSVIVKKPAEQWSGARVLADLRHRLNAMTWKHVSPERAGFASAILLGNREQLSAPRRDMFLTTGTVHLLAISGLHVGILAGSFFWLFRFGFVSRRSALIITIAFVIFYAWLVEFRPPVTRAAILLVLFCVSRLVGREGHWYNLLALAGIIVLVLNPHDLFNLGPQLSFLAVATITFGRDWIFWPPSDDPLDRLIANTRPFSVRTMYWLGRQSRTAFLVSAMIWLVALPLVAYKFHIVAPVSLIVNPFLLIPMTIALYAGLGMMVTGWFATPVADFMGSVCDWNLSVIESTIQSAQHVPMGFGWTSGPTTMMVGCFYSGLFLLVVYPPSRLATRWIALLAASWMVFCWTVPDQTHQFQKRNEERPLTITFVDVGHGSSTLIELPNGQSMLYDAGCFSSSEFGMRNVSAVLWHRRIEHLDAIVLSHADVDHFNVTPQLCEKFSIASVYISPSMNHHPSSSVKLLRDSLAKHKIPLTTIAMGDQMQVGDETKIRVIWPTESGTGDSDNADSIALAISHAGHETLLAGDLEGLGMEYLLSQPPHKYSLVMAPHHGSKNSRPNEFLQWATPEIAVISGGATRVETKVVDLFESLTPNVFRTGRDGAIRFEITETGIQCWTWKDPATDRRDSVAQWHEVDLKQ